MARSLDCVFADLVMAEPAPSPVVMSSTIVTPAASARAGEARGPSCWGPTIMAREER